MVSCANDIIEQIAHDTTAMRKQELQAELKRIEIEIEHIKASGTVYEHSSVSICTSTPGARPGKIRNDKQYHLRSREAIFNGKKSRYIKAGEVEDYRAQIERRRSLDKLEKRKQKLLERCSK